nr:MAG TPA: hypothetical protein [Caudoviricetes sp.]
MKVIEQYLQGKIKECRAQAISILEAQAECYGYIDCMYEVGKISEDEKHIVRRYVTKKFLEV